MNRLSAAALMAGAGLLAACGSRADPAPVDAMPPPPASAPAGSTGSAPPPSESTPSGSPVEPPPAPQAPPPGENAPTPQ